MIFNLSRATYYLLLLIVGVVVIGCQPGQEASSDISLEWEIDPSPARVGKATIHFVLRDSSDQRIEEANVELEGLMSHPGMQPVFAESEETSPGEYSADIEFTMAGDWIINFYSKLDEENVAEHQIRISGVRSQEP
jgi:hypothetical protein